MIFDLEYDGQLVRWGATRYRATSGLPGFQSPDRQCEPDSGPIPEGRYTVYINDMGRASDDGSGSCAIKPAWGIQHIPRGTAAGSCEPYWANWGHNRARMEPADLTTRSRCRVTRGGFYLHDSVKGFSHGCIEVDTKLFDDMRKEAARGKRRLILKVAYNGRSTNGGTKL